MTPEEIVQMLTTWLVASRERANHSGRMAPNSYGAGYDAGEADVIGAILTEIQVRSR